MVHWYIGTLVQPILPNRQRGVSSLPMRRMLVALLDSLIVMVTRMISSQVFHNTRGTCPLMKMMELLVMTMMMTEMVRMFFPDSLIADRLPGDGNNLLLWTPPGP